MQNNNNNNKNRNTGNKNNSNKPVKKRRFDYWGIIVLILVIIGVFVALRNMLSTSVEYYDANYVINIAKDNNERTKLENLEATRVGGDNALQYTLTALYTDLDKGKTREKIQLVITDAELVELKQAIGNDTFNTDGVKIVPKSSNNWLTMVLYLVVPTALLIGALFYINENNGNSKAFDFAKSKAKLNRSKKVTFKDVAGCDEEKDELIEIIDFLKSPKKYTDMGAHIPKGVLLVGAPGTGKTLLARAVAGEASVPFFSISGSDFVEMFVGVGASRVRDLFKSAKENAPCIIFIDEIDAVGRQRGAGMGGGHDEREQTLNQLLVEMDGFEPGIGIIMMAATNRPDVLDPALLRPGRFDRTITISKPDVKGRTAILKVHARNKKLDPAVKLNELAHRLPGFTGADIENLLNEAALLAARENRTSILMKDLDEATDRVMMGPAKKSHMMNKKEKNRIAHHEAGHAVIGLKLENGNIVQKVTIIPRGQAGGYNLMLPKEESYLQTESSLLDSITGYLGGRVAEELMFGDVSTGATNDFENATRIARSMVTEYGMSDLGPVQYEQQQGSVFLGRDYMKEKNFSDQVALEIDRETRRIIDKCYARAKTTISENMTLLKTISYYLIEIETITKADIDEINETGKLSWYDEEVAKQKTEEEAEKVILAEEAEKAAIEKSKQSINDARIKAVEKNADMQTKKEEESKKDSVEVETDILEDTDKLSDK